MEDQIVSERLRNKLNEVNTASQSQLVGIQDHINFTLQQMFFECAYECFDRRRKTDEISNCVEHCSVPVVQSQSVVQSEIGQFQERLQRALTVCHDRYESSKLQAGQSNPIKDLEPCANMAIDGNVKTLPAIVGRLKTSLGMNDSTQGSF